MRLMCLLLSHGGAASAAGDDVSIDQVCNLCRGNMEDALQKLQSFIDSAALAVQPIEEDPVKKKKLAKQCVPSPPTVTIWSSVEPCSSSKAGPRLC